MLTVQDLSEQKIVDNLLQGLYFDSLLNSTIYYSNEYIAQLEEEIQVLKTELFEKEFQKLKLRYR